MLAQADTGSVEMEYRVAAEQLQKHTDNFWLDGSKIGEHGLSRAWALLADWTVAYLNEHPDATEKRLKSAAPNISGTALDAIRLAPRTFLVSAGIGSFGTVFIVDGSDGEHRLAWSIRSRADRDAFPILSSWTAAAASTHCRISGEDDAGDCGTLTGQITRMPDDPGGHPRFYVNATYAQLAETTVGGQLSIWTWVGGTAHPLFVKRYIYNFEDERIRLDGDVMTVRTSDWYRSFFYCGTCIGRQMDWRLRIGSDKVEELGMAPVIPELDAVDELLYRAARHRAMDDMASDQAQEAAATLMADADRDPQDTDFISIGMVGGHAVSHRGQVSMVCLQTDGVAPMRFTMERRGGGFFITGMGTLPPNSDFDKACPHDKP